MSRPAKYEIFNPFKRYLTLQIPEGVARYRGISPGAKLVYGRLYRYAGTRGFAFPRVETLAEEVGLGVRQTKSYIDELQEQDFIRVRRRFHQTAVYEFEDHPAFQGDTGAPRTGGGSEVKVQDAALSVKVQDAALSVASQSAGCCTLTGPVSLFPEEGHLKPEEGHSALADFEDQIQHKNQHTHGARDFKTGELLPEQRPFKKPFRPGRPRPEAPPSSGAIRQRELREKQFAERSQLIAPAASGPHPTGTPTPASGLSGAASASRGDFIERWNRLVPGYPADPALAPAKASAYTDPVFATRFEEICEKARKLNEAGADLQFGRLLKLDKQDGRAWWQLLLAGELNWLAPKTTNGTSKTNQGGGNKGAAALAAEIYEQERLRKEAKAQRKKEKQARAEPTTDQIAGGTNG